MARTIQDITEDMKKLRAEMEQTLDDIQDKAKFQIQNKRIVFNKETLAEHLGLRRSAFWQILQARLFVILSAPIIYSVVIPFALLDLFVTLYQWICFPIYGIAKVKRRDYMVFDRRYLAYLNWIERLNCAYCSYATGVLAYAFEVTSRTEQYWCPIKHARRIYQTHDRYMTFFEFGDAEAYRQNRKALREKLRPDAEA
jgi:hypothetical protein